MKKVLIVSFYFPPFSGAGATRITGLSKYLLRDGWVPHVITADWKPGNTNRYSATFGREVSDCAVFRAPLADLSHPTGDVGPVSRFKSRATNFVRKRRQFSAWKRECVGEIDRIWNTQGPFDAMISTTPPWQSLDVASTIHQRYKIPWIVDFRDIFEESINRIWWNRIAKRERKLCAGASTIVTVSQDLANSLSARHTAPVHCITNGFDAEEYAQQYERITPAKFTITYTGTLYSPNDPIRLSPRMLFQALDLLESQKLIAFDDCEVKLIGCPQYKVTEHIAGTRSSRIATSVDWLDREEVVKEQQTASVLLLLGSTHHKGILTSKLFEYLAAGRPILTLPSDGGAIEHVLTSCNAGVSASTVKQAADALLNMYQKWRTPEGLTFTGYPEEIQKFSRAHQAREFIQLLNEII